MKTLQRELSELRAARDIKNGELFQEFFVKPIYKELDELKAAYSCDSLKELSRIKGKKEGLTYFISLLKSIDEEIKIKESQLKPDEE